MGTCNDAEFVSLREATDDDLELIMAWRSNPLVFRGFYLQSEPLKWEEHHAWWKSRRDRRDWIVVTKEGEHSRDVGSVNVSLLNTDTPEVSVFIGEVTLWGRGMGRRAVQLALSWLHNAGYKRVRALVLKDNVASKRLFEALGFGRVREGRGGEWAYELDIEGRLPENT